MKQDDLDYCVAKTLEVFAYAQEVAATRGLILVDTKYEFVSARRHHSTHR